jgi:hypothetical protein
MTPKPLILIPYDHRSLANQVLSEFLSLGQHFEIKIFASLGTCLGFYRDHNYIPGDNDIDVFLACKVQTRFKFYDSLVKNGFSLNLISGFAPGMNCHVFKNGIFIDSWFRQRYSYMRYYYGNTFFPDFPFDILQPSLINSYLTTVYGNWRVKSDLKANCFGN